MVNDEKEACKRELPIYEYTITNFGKMKRYTNIAVLQTGTVLALWVSSFLAISQVKVPVPLRSRRRFFPDKNLSLLHTFPARFYNSFMTFTTGCLL